MRISEELQRRSAYLDDLEALFRSRPNAWIGWRDLAKVAGACAWRTRTSDLRTKRHMRIEWNKNVRESCYRFLDFESLGRDAGTPVPQRSLFPLSPRS